MRYFGSSKFICPRMMPTDSIQCLIVDDDVDDQEIFKMAVQDVDANIECSCVNDGLQAIEKLESDHSFLPHCIFIDMNMPRMNGMQCLIAIKKIERLRSIPVYMCSTSSDVQMISQTKLNGAVDFIVKPSSVPALTEILANIYKRMKNNA
jgi:CheY-like chemotaxis protein